MVDIKKFLDDHPQIPQLLANTLASKLVQQVKDRIVDPVFDNPRFAGRIKTLPKPIQTLVEWTFHLLSGKVRTLPAADSPAGILFKESLEDVLTQVGIKINELSAEDKDTILVTALPEIRGRLQDEIKSEERNNPRFRMILASVFGTGAEWNILLDGADDALAQLNADANNHRAARKARGPWRFLW